MYPSQNQSERARSVPLRALQTPCPARSDAQETVVTPTFPHLAEESTDPNKPRKCRHSRREEIPRPPPLLPPVPLQDDSAAQEWSARSTRPAVPQSTAPRSAPPTKDSAGGR